MRVTVEGAREAARALDRAAAELDELPHTAGPGAATVILDAAAHGAPRLTGLLGSSGRIEHSGPHIAVVFGARYAPPVHSGVPSRGIPPRPFLTDAGSRTEGAWLSVYEREVDQIARRAD